MGLVQNLKKTLNNLGDKILTELSCQYIRHLAKQTLKKQDNSSLTGFSPNPLTKECQSSTIATSLTGTSEKIIMKETSDIVSHIRKWALNRIDEYDQLSVDRIYDKLAVIDEYYEWITPYDQEIEVITLDEISEDQYDDFVDYMNDGIERG